MTVPASAVLLTHPIGWIVAGTVAVVSALAIAVTYAFEEADALQEAQIEAGKAVEKQRAAELEAETVRHAATTLKEQAEAVMRGMMAQLAEAKTRLANHGETLLVDEPNPTAWKL
jgi:hypothetical protein